MCSIGRRKAKKNRNNEHIFTVQLVDLFSFFEGITLIHRIVISADDDNDYDGGDEEEVVAAGPCDALPLDFPCCLHWTDTRLGFGMVR